MITLTLKIVTVSAAMLVVIACTSTKVDKDFKVVTASVEPGSSVTMGGRTVDLYPGALKVGDDLSKSVEADLAKTWEGKVAILSFVPSIDTPVCEEQTHILGEDKGIDQRIVRVTLSRDLPMAQKRFASAAGLENIVYLSDYKSGSFGKGTGLMMRGPELLSRGVIVVDEQGVVRHLQIVPNVAELPDMPKAIAVANQLLQK